MFRRKLAKSRNAHMYSPLLSTYMPPRKHAEPMFEKTMAFAWSLLISSFSPLVFCTMGLACIPSMILNPANRSLRNHLASAHGSRHCWPPTDAYVLPPTPNTSMCHVFCNKTMVLYELPPRRPMAVEKRTLVHSRLFLDACTRSMDGCWRG